MAEQAGSCRGWHQRWRAEMRLQAHDQGVSMHEVCCDILDALCSYDQLNAANLAAAEHAARQLQLVEEKWKDRTSSSADSQEQQQDMYLYAGRATRGNLCICPLLQEWVAAELAKEYSVAKEKRKAREERALARPKPKAGAKAEKGE
eukprot:9465705-Lingulodinium_polyedra.AAC.1